jgi:hypothetical protein
LASRDALFAFLAGESLPRAEASFIDFPTGTALASGLDSASPSGDGLLAPAGSSDGQPPLDPWTSLGSGSRSEFSSDGSSVSLLGSPFGEDASLAFAGAADSYFAGLADDTPAVG